MDLLAELILKANREYSAEYAIGEVDGISNHLPMCLFALRRLGAPDERLRSFYSAYVGRLVPRHDTPNFQPENWQTFVGRNSFNNEFSSYFLSKINALGISKCLVEHLPFLLSGVGGAAFHPLIRLAYALKLGLKNEVAEALASWCMGYLGFATPNAGEFISAKSPKDILKAFSENGSFHSEKYQGSSVVAKMKAAAKDDMFWKVFKIPSRLELSEMADCAIKVFVSKPTFIGLHLVTACHAARILTNELGSIDGLLENLWTPFCIAYVTIGAPVTFERFDYECTSWDTLFTKAINSNNDHWCKFVYTCSEEQKAYGVNLYQVAATKYLT